MDKVQSCEFKTRKPQASVQPATFETELTGRFLVKQIVALGQPNAIPHWFVICP